MTVADAGVTGAPPTSEHQERELLRRHIDDASVVDAVRAVFDDAYYREQSGLHAASRQQALEHFIEVGWREGLDPHALFDTRYYLETNPQAASSGENPLVHYLIDGAAAGADPSAYFDTGFYDSQYKSPSQSLDNALVHYVENWPLGRACNPNPLFGNKYYHATNVDLRAAGADPFAHFLTDGRKEGRAMSNAHADLMKALHIPPGLMRGQWRHGSVLLFLNGLDAAESALDVRDALACEHNLDARIVLLHRPSALSDVELPPGVVVLEDCHSADVLRPSALRLLALAFASNAANSPLFAAGDVVELLAGARTAGVAAYFLVLDESAAGADLERLAAHATRVVFGSHELFRLATGDSGPYPANVAVRPFDRKSVGDFVRGTLELVERDGALIAPPVRRGGTTRQTRKIIVPCVDWGVSGVNTALETIGKGLVQRGWDLEVLFTRDRSLVEESVGPARGLPELPQRWLARSHPGVNGMWESLIADIQSNRPCIVFMGYDFYGNSVVPALTNDVGAVMWVQADDGDYYEQTYRLGRYCNAIACVSSQIRDQVRAIHPGIGERAHVIHNTSVGEADVLPRERRRSEKLRIVYTGRLVQYQKRVLDFVLLADELEALGVDFSIDLIGSAPKHDEASTLLPERAARHLDAGRMRLLGRLSQSAVLDELRTSDLFVLLSDFEGLPLSLVEAMAAGCVPVVAEMRSGISEMLVPGESGLIVEGRDYAQWARTIRDLWADEERLTAMSEHAQQAVRASFTTERIVEQFDALFAAVAEEIAAGYERPPALTWGGRRAPFGDVLPPPTMHRVVRVGGLG